MKDFLQAVWRNAARERRYALINLVGLALGFACCLMLVLFLRSELTYDRHHTQHERIYRVVGEYTMGGGSRKVPWIPRAMAPLLAHDHPELKTYVRFTDASLQDGLRLHYGDRVYNWRNTWFADDPVFEVFTHKILAGDPKTALIAESSVAISETLAKTYFGDENPLGKILKTDAGGAWKVTLVFADLPQNSHLRYDALFSHRIPLLTDASETAGLRQQLRTGYPAMQFFLVPPDFDPAEWKRIDEDFMKRYMADDPRQIRIRTWLQPLASIHYGERLDGDRPTGNPVYLYGCLAVAVFILLVACINYTNLGTARALRRARSTAIRKILGASRSRIFVEVLGDAVLFALASAVLGAALAEFAITLTPIGEMLGPGVQLDLSADPALILWILGGAVVVGLAAGLYPAIYMSSWMPVAAFASRGGGAASGARLRETLVLLQLMIAVGVVAATLVMASQMRYVANRPLGFDHENWVMITIRGTDNWLRVPALAAELRQDPKVLAVTQTQSPPGLHEGGGVMPAENARGEMQPAEIAVMEIDSGFTTAMNVGIVAGQDLPADARTRSGEHYLVNETLVRHMGWSDPIGRRIGGGRVVGVVRDFHFQSLRQPIGPLALVALSDDPQRIAEARRPFVQRRLMVRASAERFPETLEHIEQVMRRFDPGNPFEYELLDESLKQVYATDRRMLSLIAIFAALCIFISCLGLYGLTAFVTERRSREVAIRKVFGASAWQVVLLLARRTVLLTAIGGVLAVAIASIVMNEWLSGFAYRVSVSPILLSLSIVLAAGVALGTVALQSLQTARADPSETLRDE